MERLKTIGEFEAFRARVAAEADPARPTLVIPAGTCGQASGANALIRAAKRELLFHGLTERVRLRITGCHGFCQAEPSVLVQPGGIFYPRVEPSSMAIVVRAVADGEVVRQFLWVDPDTGRAVERQADVPFFRGQVRRLLARNERVDPIRVFNYLEDGGYQAFVRALSEGSPEAVVAEVKASGLRGRGGAGFPTGLKWEMLARQASAGGGFLVCNADEGDPGAYMDRSLLEGNPHSVIEGMLIGAFATGATAGIAYVRHEYPLAIKHLLIALRQARELGLLGDRILGTPFSFDIRIVRGAGAFVCGEETALIRSIEGRMGEPRQRPPYPVRRGIEGRPTAINNVETWANVPLILRDGAEAFASVGTEGGRGTKIFSLVGRVRNTGLVEVPMGISVGDIVHGLGGGAPGEGRIKAVQTGGPSGGCIPASRFDLPVDYDSLTRAGSIMGSGGMIVMDDRTCMVDVARYYMSFLKDESCGKCLTCRKGTQRMWEILDDVCKGHATPAHLDLLEELAAVVKDASMCGLGQTAANPVLSTLRHFRREYLAHVEQKRCPAGVCRDLVGAPCQSACPIGTEAWRYAAHVARGEYEEAYRTLRETNPFPSVCARVCNHPCESRCRAGGSGGQPVAIRAIKRFVTDRFDPARYRPAAPPPREGGARIAVIGAGPAGITAAHHLSLAGHVVTLFDAAGEPGGMLLGAIPAYRLPRDVVRREIAAVLDGSITVRTGQALGRDFGVDDLLGQGFRAVLLALGAHRSLRLDIPGEDAPGVIPSLRYLDAHNRRGESLARGRVVVIGGGNSAVDAARVAVRQEEVSEVTILYRRVREDMPAFREEVDAALQEGVRLETLATPTRIVPEGGRAACVRFVRNRLGDFDASGRRAPVPTPGSGALIRADTVIVAIGEAPDTDCVSVAGACRLDVGPGGRLLADPETQQTSREGVFACGDVVTGANTVVDAIAAGRRAALHIDRFVRGEPPRLTRAPRLPGVFVEPLKPPDAADRAGRAQPPLAPVEWRRRGFVEVEMALSPAEAMREASRCLRCDLEFTRPGAESPVPHPGAVRAPDPAEGGGPAC